MDNRGVNLLPTAHLRYPELRAGDGHRHPLKAAGPRNPSVTTDKYGHAIDDHKRQSVQRLDDLYAAPPQPDPQPAPKGPWMTMEW